MKFNLRDSSSIERVSFAERTPCGAVAGIDGAGVFRLHMVVGFADDHLPLKMTVSRLSMTDHSNHMTEAKVLLWSLLVLD